MEFRSGETSRHVGSLQRGREQHGLTTSTPATVPLTGTPSSAIPLINNPPGVGPVPSQPIGSGASGYSSTSGGFPSQQQSQVTSSSYTTHVPITTSSSGFDRDRPTWSRPSDLSVDQSQGVQQPLISPELKKAAYNTLNNMKDYSQQAFTNTLNYLFAGKGVDPMAYLGVKFDETKNFVWNISHIPMETYHQLFCAAAQNVCEKTELLKRWCVDHKIDRSRWDRKTDKIKFLWKDKQWVLAVQRFLDLKFKIANYYEDLFDEAVRDYAFSIKKLDRANERVIEYDRLKDKFDPMIFTSTRCGLVTKKKCAEKKFINSKIKVEELRHKILHLHQDSLEICNEALDFINTRGPELEGYLRNIGDDPDIKNSFDLLFKQMTEVRDLLNECIKCCRDKVVEFAQKKDVESWIGTRKIYGQTNLGVNQAAGTQ